MIQIRQKKLIQRQQVRKQFIDNHFKQLRKRHFHYHALNSNHQFSKSNQFVNLQILLQQSLKQNYLSQQIRTENLLAILEQYADQAIANKNLNYVKFILAIISNTFKDDLNVEQKENLFKLSFRLFSQIGLGFMHLSGQNCQKQLQIINSLTVQNLMFYMVGANSISKYLNEEDQVLVEKQIYPVFFNIFWYSLHNPHLIGDSLNDFVNDFELFIMEIFQLSQELYETINQSKIQRNLELFESIIDKHYFYLKKQDNFPDPLIKVQRKLFWLYDKLTEYYQDLKQITKKKQFIKIIELTLPSKLKNLSKNDKTLQHLFSITRTMVDNSNFIQQINQMLLSRTEKERTIIEQIFTSIQINSKCFYRSFEFLEGILICFYESKQFLEIIERYTHKLVEVSTMVIIGIDQYFFSSQSNISLLKQVLIIIYILIEYSNIQFKAFKIENPVVKQFNSLQGMKKLEIIYEQIQQIDTYQGSNISEILQIIDEILFEKFSIAW